MDQTPRFPATRIGTAAWVVTIALAFGLTTLAQAGDRVEPESSDAAVAASRSVAPWHQPSMNPGTRSKLTTAFAMAAARVEASLECAGLFAELDADGFEMLATSLYFSAPLVRQASTCRRAAAYTHVGAAATFLCGDFASLTDEDAALVLVHEALHHAGLPESPSDRWAMSSAAINDMVRKACGFQVLKKDGRAG